MQPLYEYTETGKPWPWQFYIGLIFLALFAVTGLIGNLSPGGKGIYWLAIADIIYILLLIIVFQQMLVLPKLEIKAYSSRLEIINRHGPFALQTWIISSEQIGDINYIKDSPFNNYQYALDHPNYYPVDLEMIRTFEIPQHIIVAGPHDSLIMIEGDTEAWCLGISGAEEVLWKLRNIYPRHGFFNHPETKPGKPIFEMKKPRYKHYMPLRKHLLMHNMSLFVLRVIYFLFFIDGYMPMFLIYSATLIASVIFAAIIRIVTREYYVSMTIVKAYPDHLVIALRKPWKKRVSIGADQIRDIGTLSVDKGNYINLPGYIEGFRFTPFKGSHLAVTVETDTEKWAIDIPHPRSAATALRKLYNLRT